MFRVTQKIGRSEIDLQQRFTKQVEAENFIKQKIAEVPSYSVKPSYCLYEGEDFIQEFTQNSVTDATSTTQNQSSSSQGKGQTFSPTPFNMAPRPGGVPHNWVKDEEEGKK
jgi:hypothetical protein